MTTGTQKSVAEATDLFATCHPADAAKMCAALNAAERFIAGFEHDELQDGIADLLSQIRSALDQGQTRQTQTTGASSSALPPLCYTRHPVTGDTVQIRRGEDGWHRVTTCCSPDCLNAHLPDPPTPSQVLAMKHGSIMGWDTPGANPEMWQHAVEAGAQ